MSETLTVTDSPARGRRGAYSAYTQMEDRAKCRFEGGATEPVRKRAPSDRRVSMLPSSEVEDKAPSQVPGGDKIVTPTPNKELSGSARSMATK